MLPASSGYLSQARGAACWAGCKLEIMALAPRLKPGADLSTVESGQRREKLVVAPSASFLSPDPSLRSPPVLSPGLWGSLLLGSYIWWAGLEQ